MVDILTSCYSSVVCFDFDHLCQTWRARRFEYSNTIVKECVDEKKKDDTAALPNSFGPIAFTRKSIEYLTPLVVGHIPLEISRFVSFFLERWENGGKGISKKV